MTMSGFKFVIQSSAGMVPPPLDSQPGKSLKVRFTLVTRKFMMLLCLQAKVGFTLVSRKFMMLLCLQAKVGFTLVTRKFMMLLCLQVSSIFLQQFRKWLVVPLFPQKNILSFYPFDKKNKDEIITFSQIS